MARKSWKADLPSLAAGAAIGAGAMLLRDMLSKPSSTNLPGQARVSRALDRQLSEARKTGTILLQPGHKYIVFSDHHKGGRTGADEFVRSENTYLSALDYYDHNGYTLIALGDAEEGLEEVLSKVLSSYRNVFESEARFHPDRLIRVIGNHDAVWGVEALVKEFIHPIMPGLAYLRGLILKYDDGPDSSGEIFLAHGHQGTLDSDIFPFLAKFFLPYYRNVQILTGIGGTSPSKDDCLRSFQDNRMYAWTTGKDKLLLIAGHTHRPVWCSLTHLDKLMAQYYALQGMKPEDRPVDYADRLAGLKLEIEERQVKYPPCFDVVKTRPSYFNTGCCSYSDGDITGIELEDGCLRLVKWDEGASTPWRVVLEERPLREIFFEL